MTLAAVTPKEIANRVREMVSPAIRVRLNGDSLVLEGATRTARTSAATKAVGTLNDIYGCKNDDDNFNFVAGSKVRIMIPG